MTYSVPLPYIDSPITTSAVANTSVNTVIIGAPGVGFAIRILAINVCMTRVATGMLNATFFGTFSGTIWRVVGYGPPPGMIPATAMFPEPGIAMQENDALGIQHNSNVASQTFFVNVLYFIDFIG